MKKFLLCENTQFCVYLITYKIGLNYYKGKETILQTEFSFMTFPQFKLT
jgi:hypothetical protein